MFSIFKDEILKKYSVNFLLKIFNLNKGTIDRWCLKRKVPIDYFLTINKLLNYKYELKLSNDEKFKQLDQFFTDEKLAKKLINKTIEFINNNYKNIDLNNYLFIEPSAGSGSFYQNIPKNFKKIGFDIEPFTRDIIKADWLDTKYISDKKCLVIGNPPFGLRGQVALKFINHCADFCDFVCFILPPLFSSNGKGSPMLRVDNRFKLVYEEKLDDINFYYPNNSNVKINSVFQIWTKLESDTAKQINIKNKNSEWVKIYSLSNGKDKSSKRNVHMIGKCDFYLPSTTFNKIKVYKEYDKLPHNRGYGILILKNKNIIEKIINKIDWDKVSFKSTNSANNLRSQLIIDEIERYL